MNEFEGKELICLRTTRPDGTVYTCFYVYETEASWSYYDGSGKHKPNVKWTREVWDGKSMVITGNGD